MEWHRRGRWQMGDGSLAPTLKWMIQEARGHRLMRDHCLKHIKGPCTWPGPLTSNLRSSIKLRQWSVVAQAVMPFCLRRLVRLPSFSTPVLSYHVLQRTGDHTLCDARAVDTYVQDIKVCVMYSDRILEHDSILFVLAVPVGSPRWSLCSMPRPSSALVEQTYRWHVLALIGYIVSTYATVSIGWILATARLTTGACIACQRSHRSCAFSQLCALCPKAFRT